MQDNLRTDSKYLSFRLAEETYGVAILKVREIIGLMPITSVPRAAAHIRGVINLRGKIVPVLDMRAKFGLPGAEARRENCIITVMADGDQGPLLLGVLVDSVSEVIVVADADIEPLPALGKNLSLDFVMGLAKAQGKVTILLDVDKVLASGEILGLPELNAALAGTAS